MKRGMCYFVSSVLLTTILGCGTVFKSAAEGQKLFINEIMAANTKTLRDGDLEDPKNGSDGGAYSDWIEIYNGGTEAVNMEGYTISDDSATWIFPKGIVPPKGHLIVWASDKNKVTNDGGLHSNFKISSSGENIVLADSKGNTLDSVLCVSLGDDLAYGRKSDGSSEYVVFTNPSPGKSNLYQESAAAVLAPQFSKPGGFYTDAFDLEMSTNEQGVKIYYTTNGSDPVPGESDTIEYKESLRIKSRVGDPNVLSMIQNISGDRFNQWKAPNGEIFKCSTIKAVAVRSDGNKSKIVTNSYFVDSEIFSRYTLPVFSIVTDESNLFEDTSGIYVNGNFDNAGSEWERPIHVEFFEKDGTLGFSQYAGVRIHGGYTRKYPQKSFRIIADKKYDTDKGKFKYEIFPGLTKNGTGKSLKSFERLILRNAGNDWTSALFRDEMMQTLVSHLNIDTQAYRPSVLFLNGEYWGIYNIRERYDHKYLADNYDLDDKKVALLDLYEEIDVQEGTQEDADAYTNEIINYLKSHSITEKSTYDYINTKMDIQNYIAYNVAEIFFGNTDWPGNNMSIWKYKTDDGQYHPEAPYGQDGRWRWLLKDTDFGFGLYGKSVTHNTLNFASSERVEGNGNPTWATYLFRTLLQNSDFRNEFINTFADNLNTSFDPVRVNKIIDDISSVIAPEMQEHTDRWQVIKLVATTIRDTTWDQAVTQIKNYGTSRPNNVRQHILNKFSVNGVTGTSKLNLKSDSEAGYIKVNTIDIKDSTPGVTNSGDWTGIYFKGVPVNIKAIANKGYEFDHWEGITGNDSRSKEITLNITGDIAIKAVFKEALSAPPTPTPDINPSPTPDNDILYGDINNDRQINSTDMALLKRYLLEIVVLEPGKIAVIDLNKDGNVNSTDLAILKRYILGIILKLPHTS